MNQVGRLFVWLSRLHRCRGFGIQSPKDYAFVRYVVNERWPYYAYQELPERDWMTRKLGKLYFRLANWRQPSAIAADRYAPYWKAGCRRVQFKDSVEQVELARFDVEDQQLISNTLPYCDSKTVLIIEGIYRDWEQWHQLEKDPRTGTTFDLYYCGIILFDTSRYKQNYKINF